MLHPYFGSVRTWIGEPRDDILVQIRPYAWAAQHTARNNQLLSLARHVRQPEAQHMHPSCPTSRDACLIGVAQPSTVQTSCLSTWCGSVHRRCSCQDGAWAVSIFGADVYSSFGHHPQIHPTAIPKMCGGCSVAAATRYGPPRRRQRQCEGQ